MWQVYDHYNQFFTVREYYSVQEAGDWIEASYDPLTYRIQYVD